MRTCWSDEDVLAAVCVSEMCVERQAGGEQERSVGCAGVSITTVQTEAASRPIRCGGNVPARTPRTTPTRSGQGCRAGAGSGTGPSAWQLRGRRSHFIVASSDKTLGDCSAGKFKSQDTAVFSPHATPELHSCVVCVC